MKRQIRVYFDFACPYCYNEWEFMKRIRQQVDLDIEYYSWEIHPEAPEEGAKKDWPGAEEMLKEVSELGKPVGIAAGNMRYTYNSRKALQLLEEAIKQGLADTYIDAVFHAYFEEQVNVGKDEVILGIAEKVGIKGAREVLAENRYVDVILAHDKHCMDIALEYVPTIEENGKIILSGVLTLEDMEKEFLK